MGKTVAIIERHKFGGTCVNAGRSALAAIGKAGILTDVSAEKLLAIAKMAYEEFGSDLRSVLKKPLPQAKKALKRFPSIGDPGAEKILLVTRSHPAMALDSNGLRVYVNNSPETTIR